MDKQNRVTLLLICVLVGEGPCMATYMVTQFWQLLVTRMLTGIAVGGVALEHVCLWNGQSSSHVD
jgi:predicted MFS family arabinose efflux permease